MDKLPERKCKCGLTFTRKDEVLWQDNTAMCVECAETARIMNTYGLDPWRARIHARRVLA